MTSADLTSPGIKKPAATYKVLAADELAEEGLTFIRCQNDAELVYKPGLGEQEMAEIIGKHDGMIVRSGVKITAKVLLEPGRLKVIARAGVGVDNIDIEAATRAGILVINTAEASTTTTAEHAFALMLGLARNIGPAYRSMSEGRWERNQYRGTQLSGKTLGVIGFGRIGRAVTQRALVFGMKVVGFDPLIHNESEMGGTVKMVHSFAQLAPLADIITFHVPLNDQTRNMLDAASLQLCRRGVLVVNAARGGIIDEQALLAAIESGLCGGAALDVFSNEPPGADHALRGHPKILLTPHLGASTVEAQQAVSIGAAEALLAYLRGHEVRGAVNAPGIRFDLDPLQVAFLDLAHRMGMLICPMLGGGLESVSFEMCGPRLAKASQTIEGMGMIGLLKDRLTVPPNLVNITHIAEQYGIQRRTVITEDNKQTGNCLAMELKSSNNAPVRRIVGRIYDDLRPRIVEINGYHMDMIPSGTMVLLQNEDRPGMIGLVGMEFGKGAINIADMTISRRDQTALMVLKVDAPADDAMIHRLQNCPGIFKVVRVRLPPLRSG